MKRSWLSLTALAFGLLLATSAPVIAADLDGDGYDSAGGDCDDTNEFINPGATELPGDEVDQDCDAHENCYLDGDDDGYRTTIVISSFNIDCVEPTEARASDPTGDCDDSDSGINPSATEVCDGGNADEDCDGFADDDDSAATGKTTWYADADADGHGGGGGGGGVLACDAPLGHVANSDDCDDADPDIHPDATEVCDGGDVDEDCDSLPDDFDSFAAGKTTWYGDEDGDGYGSSGGGGGGVLACDAPFGTVGNDGDCDDSDAGVNPAGTETCDAGNVDEDCDGTVDDADLDATGKSSWYADADGDGYGGGGGGGTLACDAPVGHVGNDGDCDDADAAVSPGDPEVCDAGGVDDDCDGVADCDDSSCSSEPSCLGTVEVFDHLECFKIKTTEKLKGTLDVDPGTNPPFELAPGCTIGKATKYCVPVMKTVAVLDDSSTLTQDPGFEGQDLTDDRICYKVKCPDTAATTITLTVHDRFGSRDFTKFKSTEICTPAEQIP